MSIPGFLCERQLTHISHKIEESHFGCGQSVPFLEGKGRIVGCIEGSLSGSYWNFVCRLSQRGFRLRKEKREAEKGKKRAALAPGRIQNFAADYLLGQAGDAGFGRKRPYQLTHHLNGYDMTLD
ncbi:hypothetical protein AVEN_175246-1 [Araneus ventricosus]|uniref:Uncharacterized protein n=1 Tax=Araneus ventricosus TaxID=182803 RepID=A0A4Y2LKK5_ARAVE|nr:hypothetical protein AVEN_175246-1 [Araneus ventricosus]